MLIRLRRLTRRLLRLIPDLPDYTPRGDLVIAQAVVLRGGASGAPEVLLVRRTSPTGWELPGGNVEPGEDPQTAAVREVKEETGIDVMVQRLLGIFVRTGFRPHRSPVYVCVPIGGALRHNDESLEVGFAAVNALPRGLFPWYRPIIATAVAGRAFDAPQRQHLGVRATLHAGLIHAASVMGLAR